MLDASVIVAARDARDTIGRAVRSALAQAGVDVEVVLVDDASRDGTADAARTAAGGDPRLRVVTLGRNLGPAGARNRGIEAARGRWIAILDSDDAFEPRRLETLIGLAEGREADMACDDLLLVDEERGEVVGPMSAGEGLPETIDAVAFVTGNLPDRRNPRRGYGFLKPILRAGFLRAHALSYDPSMRFAEDYAFYVGCLLAGAGWVATSEPLYRYGVRAGSLTATHGAAELERLCRVDERALAHPAVVADPALRRALRRHLVAARKRERWALFIDQFKARRFGALPRTAAHSPEVFAHVAGRCLAEAALRSRRAAARLAGR